MERQTRQMSLPVQMQGRWVDIDDHSSELIIKGGEIMCFGQVVDYDYKLIETEDDALTVSLKVEDEAREDDFQQSNLTGLVITPEGEFHIYNVNFASQFVKAEG